MRYNDQNKDINWNLLANYFAKEANNEEINKVKAWLNTDDENKKIFLKLYSIWQLTQLDRIDEKAAWKRVKENLPKQKRNIVSLQPMFYKIAASILIIAAIVYSFINHSGNSIVSEEFVTVTSYNNLKKINLPDGSVVHLNKNSNFRYPQHFNKNTRDVFIDGEGFFEVVKNTSIPFIVTTTHFNIKVVGTSFNIDSYSSKSTANVIVKTGKVFVSQSSGTIKNHLILVKNEMATLDIEKDSLFKNSSSHNNYLAWKSGILEFDNTMLSEVIESLNKVYDTHITFGNDALKTCVLTAQFNNRSLKEVIAVLESTYSLKVEWASNRIKLYGISCD